MKPTLLALTSCICLAALLTSASLAQNPTAPVARPAIVGVAHIGLKTDDLAAARKFYTGILGFQEPFSLDKASGEGTGLLLTYFKVNDHQYIEMFPELTDPKMDRLSHISFETTDAEQMRAYLASRGVKVPEKLEPMQDGNRGFDVKDPDGHDVEFVEFRPGSLHSRNFGKFLPETRISRWGEGLTAEGMKNCVWLRPKFVAQIEFLEWTESDHLRHSKFVGLREDKDPRSVVKELR